MKPKEKKCKGLGIAQGQGCGDMALFRKYGLCNECLRDFYINTPEGMEKVVKSTLKVSAPRKSLEKAFKTDKETKGIQAALSLTKQVVHEMVRLRDKGRPCVACGCQWNVEFHACHVYAANSYKSIRYHFHNLHGGCINCNIFLNGNETQYLINLPKRIGDKNFKSLKKLAELDAKFNKHWTKHELSEIRKEARLIIKQLEK